MPSNASDSPWAKSYSGIHAPVGAAAIMGRVPDAEQQRVPHQHVGMRHVDPGTEHVGAVRELPRPHPPQQVEVLLDRAIAIRAGCAGHRDRATALPDALLALRIHVRLAGLDQPLGNLVQPLEVIAGEALLVPLESEPADVVPDGVDVPEVFGGRVGIVEPQVAAARELGGDPEVETDGLGVPDVQVAVGLGREPGVDRPAEAAAGHVRGDLLAQKVLAWRLAGGGVGLGRSVGVGHGGNLARSARKKRPGRPSGAFSFAACGALQLVSRRDSRRRERLRDGLLHPGRRRLVARRWLGRPGRALPRPRRPAPRRVR